MLSSDEKAPSGLPICPAIIGKPPFSIMYFSVGREESSLKVSSIMPFFMGTSRSHLTSTFVFLFMGASDSGFMFMEIF